MPTNLSRVLTEAMNGASAPARNREVAVVSAIGPDLEADVDPDVLRRVLDNLLDNAIRHSPSGGRVVVAARAEGDLVALDVIDDGPGIPIGLRERIFEKFGQSERGGHRPSNHGLGLTFVRMALRAHGGDAVVVDDGRPRGTCFRVLFPLVGAEPPSDT